MALMAPLRALLLGLRAIRREGSVVINLLDSGPDMLLRTDAAMTLEDRTALTAFANRHGLPRVSQAGVSQAGMSQVGPHDLPETIGLLRPPVTSLSGVAVRPPPGAFLQATGRRGAIVVRCWRHCRRGGARKRGWRNCMPDAAR